MPFQNIITIGGNVVSVPILSVSIGPDIFAICDPSTTLTAVVVAAPGDNTVHTYLWEQLSGDVVSFDTSPAALSVSYSTASFGDKVFRFTVDKGTLSEVSNVITVFGTPTSAMPVTRNNVQLVNNPCRSVTLTFLNNPTTINKASLTSQYRLNWTTPTCDEYAEHLIEYRVQRKPALGAWITFDVVSAGNDRTSITPNIIDSFRILVVYIDGDNYPSNVIYFTTPSLSGIMITNNTLAIGNLSTIGGYIVDDLSLITQSVESNMTLDIEKVQTISLYVVDDLTGTAIGG